MKYTVIVDGERTVVEAENASSSVLKVKVGERQYAVDYAAVEPGVYWVNWQNRSDQISVTPNGSGYVVSLGRQRFYVEVEDERSAFRKIGHSGSAGEIELRAPMPGKIVKLLVDEGVDVEVNQGILVMEAMKMQNEIKSPKNGKLKRLEVVAGAAVNAGEILAVIE
jgi:biotin carboxyl carrier protein